MLVASLHAVAGLSELAALSHQFVSTSLGQSLQLIDSSGRELQSCCVVQRELTWKDPG